MTDIAEPIVTRNCHGNVDTIIFLQCIGHRQNIGRHPRSDIEGVPRYPFSLQAENRGVRHIVDIDEVARFASVLENIDSVSVLDTGGEDRQNARIGIAQRLARAVHVLVTKRYGLHSDTLANQMDELPLYLLGDSVHRIGMDRRVFRRRDQAQRFRTLRIFYLEIAPRHRLVGTF